MWFKTSHVVVSESQNKIFVSRIVFFLLITLKFREVILPHAVQQEDQQTNMFRLLHVDSWVVLPLNSPIQIIVEAAYVFTIIKGHKTVLNVYWL